MVRGRRRKEPSVALGLTILVFSPYLYWNLTNEWAGFRMQLWDRHYETSGEGIEKLAEFVVEQLANPSPFLALPLLGCLFVSPAKASRSWLVSYRFLRCQSLTILGFFAMLATAAETHPHWTLLAYPPAAIALAVLWTSAPNHWSIRGIKWWIGLSYGSVMVGLCLVAAGASLVSQETLRRLGGSPGRVLAQAQADLVGWSDLRRRLEPFRHGATNGDDAILFTDDRERAAQLSFHHAGTPVINLAAYLGRGRRLGDAQWCYLPVDRLAGRSGLFVTESGTTGAAHLRLFFQGAEQVGSVEQRSGGEVLRHCRVLRVDRFKAGP